VAPPVALINPFPVLGGLSTTVHFAALGMVGVAFLYGAFSLLRRWRRQAAVTELGRQRGLGEQSAAFLGSLFAGEGLDAAETMLSAPDLLRARLARELRRRHRDESAIAYAARAAHLLEELNTIPLPFPGAPTPFLQLTLQDAADPHSDMVTAWVLSVDERNITIISRHVCEWPMRRELLATPPEGHGEAFRASLLLRPVPPRHEWVLTHDLVDVITNRRATVRVPCCLQTHVLPDNGDIVLLRERLADQETVQADDLRRMHGWAQRHAATVVDVSSDGCRLELEHEVALRDRFHVMFTAPDDRLAGLPLAEVVALQRASAGRVAAGVRFIGMRLKERTRLAEFVRAIAMSQGGAVASAVRALEAAEASAAAALARGAAAGATVSAKDTPPSPADGATVAAAAFCAAATSSSQDDDVAPDEPTPGLDARAAGSGHQHEHQHEPADDHDLTIDAEEHRRAMERLRLGLEAPLPDPIERPFEYEPRFVKNPFAATETTPSPPPAPPAPQATPAPQGTPAPQATPAAAHGEPSPPTEISLGGDLVIDDDLDGDGESSASDDETL